MSESPESMFPMPGPEHERLMKAVGTWDIATTYFMGPDKPPVSSAGREVIEAHGPFWTVSLYEADVMGFPMKGRATVGYCPVRKKWLGTWIDSMTPYFFSFEGGYDAEGKVCTMTCEAPNMQTQAMAKYRTTLTEVDEDHRHFEMFMECAPGQEMQLFRHEYTRVK